MYLVLVVTDRAKETVGKILGFFWGVEHELVIFCVSFLSNLYSEFSKNKNKNVS